MKQENKLIVKVPHTKRRADFLFHNGEFRHQVIENGKIYNRKKVEKLNPKDIDRND